jgi:hypothetical protein
VLPGARLGDDPVLAHASRQQGLTEGVVELVGAGVAEVLALQVNPVAVLLRETFGEVEWRRPSDEVALMGLELGLECGVGPGSRP